MLIYITGFSGSGKTTIGKALQSKIPNSILLDGDEIRKSLNIDLGYSKPHKIENIRRNNELIKLLYSQGFTVIACFMSSIKDERDKVFTTCEYNVKVQLITPVEVCKARDVKGLYSKNLENFSGVSFPYEGFGTPDIAIDTSIESLNTSVNKVYTKYREALIKNT